MSDRAVRPPSRARPYSTVGAVLLLALIALAALLLAGALSERGAARIGNDHPSVTVAVAESKQAAPSLHGFHPQPSTRGRSVAFGVLALAVLLGASAFRRVRVMRSGRPRTLRIAGLPPGRAPPRLHIA